MFQAKYFDLLNKTKLASQSKQLKNVNSFNNHDWQSTNAGGKEEFTTDLNKKETPLPVVQKNFNAQVALNDKLYSIQIKYNNSTNQNSDEKQINNTVSKFFVINNPSTPMMHRKTQEIYSKPVDAGNEQKLRLKFPNGVVPIPFESNIMADDSAILSSEKVKDGQKVEQNEVPVQNEQKMEGLNIVNDEVVQKQSNNIVGDDENKLKNEVNDDQVIIIFLLYIMLKKVILKLQLKDIEIPSREFQRFYISKNTSKMEEIFYIRILLVIALGFYRTKFNTSKSAKGFLLI